MSKVNLGRLGLTLVSLLGLMALWSASASAALPNSLKVSSGAGLASLNISGSANPNGLATTAKLEYREEGTAEWKVALTKELGAGTSSVEIGPTTVNGVTPSVFYEVRLSATNKSGTVYDTTPWAGSFGGVWVGIAGQLHNEGSEFSSAGTLKIEYTESGKPVKFECTESGYGSIGHLKGAGDSYHVTPSGCIVYISGKAVCEQKLLGFWFDSTFTDETGTHYFIPCFRDPEGGGEWNLNLTAPLHVAGLKFVSAVTQAATATAPAMVLGHAATFTITSNWNLSGINVGKKWWLSPEPS